MNGIIKRLAEQAEEIVFHSPSTGQTTKQLNVEKFAELIILHCAHYVDNAISDGGIDGRALKEHFGVEE